MEVVHQIMSFKSSEVKVFKDGYVASLLLPHIDLLFPKTQPAGTAIKCWLS
jgi:hypothetical protein